MNKLVLREFVRRILSEDDLDHDLKTFQDISSDTETGSRLTIIDGQPTLISKEDFETGGYETASSADLAKAFNDMSKVSSKKILEGLGKKRRVYAKEISDFITSHRNDLAESADLVGDMNLSDPVKRSSLYSVLNAALEIDVKYAYNGKYYPIAFITACHIITKSWDNLVQVYWNLLKTEFSYLISFLMLATDTYNTLLGSNASNPEDTTTSTNKLKKDLSYRLKQQDIDIDAETAEKMRLPTGQLEPGSLSYGERNPNYLMIMAGIFSLGKLDYMAFGEAVLSMLGIALSEVIIIFLAILALFAEGFAVSYFVDWITTPWMKDVNVQSGLNKIVDQVSSDASNSMKSISNYLLNFKIDYVVDAGSQIHIAAEKINRNKSLSTADFNSLISSIKKMSPLQIEI